MKHLKKGKKFGRKRGERRSFLKVLANNLVEREKILTTEARAKELRPYVERLITYGKNQDLAGLRLLKKRLTKRAAYKIYYEIAPRFEKRKGGYTRIQKTALLRKGDGARLSSIEFVK